MISFSVSRTNLSGIKPDLADRLIAAVNIDPDDPTAVTFTNQIDPNMDAPKVDELIIGAEYELAKKIVKMIQPENL